MKSKAPLNITLAVIAILTPIFHKEIRESLGLDTTNEAQAFQGAPQSTTNFPDTRSEYPAQPQISSQEAQALLGIDDSGSTLTTQELENFPESSDSKISSEEAASLLGIERNSTEDTLSVEGYEALLGISR